MHLIIIIQCQYFGEKTSKKKKDRGKVIIDYCPVLFMSKVWYWHLIYHDLDSHHLYFMILRFWMPKKTKSRIKLCNLQLCKLQIIFYMFRLRNNNPSKFPQTIDTLKVLNFVAIKFQDFCNFWPFSQNFVPT